VDITSKNPKAFFTFHWDYNTSDIGAGLDQFGLLLNGNHTVLSDLGGPVHQTRCLSRPTQFRWYQLYGLHGSGDGRYRSSRGQYEPGSLVLLGLGLVSPAPAAALRMT
jgi:hypothetical protein